MLLDSTNANKFTASGGAQFTVKTLAPKPAPAPKSVPVPVQKTEQTSGTEQQTTEEMDTSETQEASTATTTDENVEQGLSDNTDIDINGQTAAVTDATEGFFTTKTVIVIVVIILLAIFGFLFFRRK